MTVGPNDLEAAVNNTDGTDYETLYSQAISWGEHQETRAINAERNLAAEQRRCREPKTLAEKTAAENRRLETENWQMRAGWDNLSLEDMPPEEKIRHRAQLQRQMDDFVQQVQQQVDDYIDQVIGRNHGLRRFRIRR